MLNDITHTFKFAIFLYQVGCEAIICSEDFKDQTYYDILFNLIPELSRSVPGDINSHT